jgi:hypothetical protein
MIPWFDLLRLHVAGVRAILQQHMYPPGRMVKLFSREKIADNLSGAGFQIARFGTKFSQ